MAALDDLRFAAFVVIPYLAGVGYLITQVCKYGRHIGRRAVFHARVRRFTRESRRAGASTGA